MRLVRLRQARIAEASVDAGNMARVMVSFESDLSDGENMRNAKESDVQASAEDRQSELAARRSHDCDLIRS